MQRFRYWRKMTWAILLGSALLLVWVVTGGFTTPAIGLSVAFLAVLGAIWLLSQPPWRQGRGLHLRRPQYVDVPFKTPTSTSPQDIS